MVGVSFVRVIRAAMQNFWRNVWLSIATTLIMTITLLMMSGLYFANVFGNAVLRSIEQKVDLSVTFKTDAATEDITSLVKEIESRDDVENVRLVTSEEALTLFRQRHKDDPFIEESLKEIEANPLPASLFIVAVEPRLYESIADDLLEEQEGSVIEKVNFENSRPVIEKLINVMTTIKNGGTIATGTFAILVMMIMFNTVRLAIYSFREEIDIMRLVGASNWFIQGPFLFEAILVALASVALSTATIYPALKALSPHLARFFFTTSSETFDLFAYATANWVTVVGLQAILASALASISSLVAIRRYLRH